MHFIQRIATALLVVGWIVATPLVVHAKDPLLAGGGGGYCYEPPAEMDAGWVAVGDNCFTPQRIEVATGETVRWSPAGQGTHNVTFDGGPSSESIPADGYGITFRAPGTYQYSCTLHPGMAGTVVASGDTLSGPALEVLGPGSRVAAPVGSRTASSPTTSVLSDASPMRLELSPLTAVVLLTIGLPLSLGVAARFVGIGTAAVRRPQPRRPAVGR